MDIMRMGKNPNFLGSWDLDDVEGRILTLTIAKIVDEEVQAGGQKDTCTVCYFEENYKPMIMNITNKKRLAKLYKTKQTENLIGKRISITTEKVKAFGDIYDALRFVPKIPADKPTTVVKCEQCGNKLIPFGRLSAEEVGAYTKKKYGRILCNVCAEQESKKDGAVNEA